MSNWSYQNHHKWPSMYKECSLKNNPKQSPINIIPADIIQECSAKCEVILKYKPSKCYIVNDHNTITINYDPGSYIIYQNNWYQLTKAKIHTTSLHTVDGQHYGAEINLYHCADNECTKGIILAIFLNRGPDNGESVDFINQFINQVPLSDNPVEREIEVADNWNIISLIPSDRTCFVYDGSLPHPPCTSEWKWIVFNNPSTIGMTALKTLQYNIINLSGANIRTPLNLKSFEDVYKIPHDSVKVFEERPIRTEPPKLDEKSVKKLQNPNDANLSIFKGNKSLFTQYYLEYKYILRMGLILVLYVLTVILAIKITKYIIKNDLVNQFLNRKIEGVQEVIINNTTGVVKQDPGGPAVTVTQQSATVQKAIPLQR
jgi:carbonic anhydrase